MLVGVPIGFHEKTEQDDSMEVIGIWYAKKKKEFKKVKKKVRSILDIEEKGSFHSRYRRNLNTNKA